MAGIGEIGMLGFNTVLAAFLVFAVPLLVVSCSGDEAIQPTLPPTLTPDQTVVATPTPTTLPSPAPTPGIDYTIHTDTTNGFSLSYPVDWNIKTLPRVLFSVVVPEQCKGYDTGVFIYKADVPYLTDIELYYSSTISGVFTSPERSFIFGEKIDVSGKPAIKLISSIEGEGSEPFVEISIYIMDDTAAWTLSFVTISSCWDEYRNVFEYMAESFKLLS